MGERDVDRIIEAWRTEARGAGESAPREPARSEPTLLQRIGWLRLCAGGAGAVLLIGVALAVMPGQAQPAPVVVAASPSPTRTGEPAAPRLQNWFALIQEVDAARAAAYAEADAAALADVFAADGPALAAERTSIEAMRSAGVRAEGWRTTIQAVSPLLQLPDRVELRVSDVREGYEVVAADGDATSVPAAARSDWHVELHPAGDGWVVHSTRPFEPADATGRPSQP